MMVTYMGLKTGLGFSQSDPPVLVPIMEGGRGVQKDLIHRHPHRISRLISKDLRENPFAIRLIVRRLLSPDAFGVLSSIPRAIGPMRRIVRRFVRTAVSLIGGIPRLHVGASFCGLPAW